MPVKPDHDSKHLQLVISNGEKFHQTLTILLKNSDVLVQPTDASQLHITLHSNIGTKNRKNCHFRIENSEVRKFNTTSTGKKINNGMLVEWNREISPAYDCPLELRFPSRLAASSKANIKTDYDTIFINYGSGTLYVNFWFTSVNKEELSRYLISTGVDLLMFEQIPKTDENFALTCNISDSDECYKNIEKVDDYFEIDVSHKKTTPEESWNKVQFTFGLAPETKKSIIFY